MIIRDEIKKEIVANKVKKYHFALFRNLLEKTANYLGYDSWKDCLIVKDTEEKELYSSRINDYTHNRYSDLENSELSLAEQRTLKILVEEVKSILISSNFRYNIEVTKEYRYGRHN